MAGSWHMRSDNHLAEDAGAGRDFSAFFKHIAVSVVLRLAFFHHEGRGARSAHWKADTVQGLATFEIQNQQVTLLEANTKHAHSAAAQTCSQTLTASNLPASSCVETPATLLK